MLLAFGRDRYPSVGEAGTLFVVSQASSTRAHLTYTWLESIETHHMGRNTNAAADIGSEPYHTSMHVKQSGLAARRASGRVSRHHRIGRQTPERVLSLTPLRGVSIVTEVSTPFN